MLETSPILFVRRDSIVPPEALGDSDVHVWAAINDTSSKPREDILSAAERGRAERFRFLRDRTRFIASHSFLRHTLASYVGGNPADLEFAASDRGKPFLVGCGNLHFNLSHAGGVAVCAVGRSSLGIDIEVLKGMDDAEAMATRWFTPREKDLVLAMPREQQSRTFLEVWTRKEAVLKAEGIGLAGISDERLANRWFVRPFQLSEETIGALATSPAVRNVTALLIGPL